jgi:hypothetical protein
MGAPRRDAVLHAPEVIARRGLARLTRWRRLEQAAGLHRRDEAEAGMTRYDPLRAPDPDAWLAMSEDERIALAADFHRRAGDRAPSARAHAAIHCMVENQIALGEATPVRAAMERLMAEGLDRHEAIHAVGSVLAGLLSDLARGEGPADFNAAYGAELAKVTAESWRGSGG